MPTRDVSEILDVRDSDGNVYYEVEYLTQDTVFKKIPNATPRSQWPQDQQYVEAGEIEGLEGLKKSVSEKEFNFYLQNTKNLESYSKDIKKVLANPNFNFHKQKPTFEMLRNAIVSGNVCEIVLDPRKLRNEEGFSLHRVVVLEINNIEVTFHDPAVGEFQKTSIENFTSAWLIAVNEPELCIYESKTLNL
jgi:hypothetical protein